MWMTASEEVSIFWGKPRARKFIVYGQRSIDHNPLVEMQ